MNKYGSSHSSSKLFLVFTPMAKWLLFLQEHPANQPIKLSVVVFAG